MKRTEKIERKVFIPIEEAESAHQYTEDMIYGRAHINPKWGIEILNMGDQVIQGELGYERGYVFIVRGERELPDMKKRHALIKKVRRLGFLPGGK
jgi:hypothetical protein